MLKKFISIKNVGVFRDAPAGGNTELRKMTLVHAENARGETTLCNIFRSLQSADANLVLERKTVDGTGQPHVQILADDNTRLTFSDGAWTAPFPKLAIFDATFVAENVYQGGKSRGTACRCETNAQAAGTFALRDSRAFVALSRRRPSVRALMCRHPSAPFLNTI